MMAITKKLEMRLIKVGLLILGALASSKHNAWADSDRGCEGADNNVISQSVRSFSPLCQLLYIYPTIGVFYGVTFIYKCKQKLHNLDISHFITFTSGFLQYGIRPRDENGKVLPFNPYKKFYDVSKEEPEIPAISKKYVIRKRNITCKDIAQVLSKARELSPRPP